MFDLLNRGICNPPTPTTGKAILLAADFKSGGTPSGHLRILRIPSLLAARPEKAKALKMRPFCNISVKVLDLHQEIGGF